MPSIKTSAAEEAGAAEEVVEVAEAVVRQDQEGWDRDPAQVRVAEQAQAEGQARAAVEAGAAAHRDLDRE